MTHLINSVKKKIAAYLERMAEENKKNFGNQRLDCCSLNKARTPNVPKKAVHHTHQ